ncbi:MAG: ABC transporter ATP-binding protein [Aestuariivita sp.]|nr:ABC transporter ATP-binding protein [Aestuariivita sp.]MCY4203403.1 ABC transporter ATP-binding protein [Aestuariivita sp.]
MNNAHSVLRIRDLNKSFAGIVAAKNINTDIKPGEVVGIIGANGAGKTVFVNMITGYLKPTSGLIEFEGRNITGIEPRNATHISVSRSFQISQVFMSMTVMNNLLVAISLANRDSCSLLRPLNSPRRVRECERVMECYQLLKYRDQVAGTLAQGVRKLLDIAMAVVSKPRLLLLDEPTSGVSIDEKFDLMDIVVNALKEQGTAVLFVEHDMDIVQRYVDRIMAFYQGEIICDAPPELALRDAKVIEYVLGSRHGTEQVDDRPKEPRHA